ncbi:MAG: hypothetical protein GKR97_16580 [Rhizobiaceae bacterium]|nr:hypothetical protein [Rhizobiaceae bacterium]
MIVKRRQLTSVFEIGGSTLGIFYAFLIASNTGYELASFTMLLLSACLFAGWAIIDHRWSFLLLQLFYAATAMIGLVRFA